MNAAVIVDTSNLLHRYAARRGDSQKVVRDLHLDLQSLQRRYSDHEIIFAWDGRAQWRYKLHPEYKGSAGRQDPSPKAETRRRIVKEAGETFKQHVPICGGINYYCPTLEADDIAAIVANRIEYDKVILVSHDEDWQQIVLANYRKASIAIKPEEMAFGSNAIIGKYSTYGPQAFVEMKALVGDSSDNISGWPGIGETGAFQLFKTLKECGETSLTSLKKPLVRTNMIDALQEFPRMKQVILFIKAYTAPEASPDVKQFEIYKKVISLNPNQANYKDAEIEVEPATPNPNKRKQILQEYKVPTRR